ncbi:SDR family oxidoreductase [Mycolicibacterium mageritense]
MSRTWFITGAARGFGREWTLAALQRGDRVAASARNASRLDDLTSDYGASVLPIELDVTDRRAVFDAVRTAHEHFGNLDIVVNNAGYGLYGFVEELTERQARDQMETNFFGALWVTQAALPILRAQQYGHLVQVSSGAGVTTAPGVGLYSASKHALEAFSESLATEIASFGIHVTLVEPGLYSTDINDSATYAAPLSAYASAHSAAAEMVAEILGEPGDPGATRDAICKIVDAQSPPLRVLFGPAMLSLVESTYRQRLENWAEWKHVTIQAYG